MTKQDTYRLRMVEAQARADDKALDGATRDVWRVVARTWGALAAPHEGTFGHKMLRRDLDELRRDVAARVRPVDPAPTPQPLVRRELSWGLKATTPAREPLRESVSIEF